MIKNIKILVVCQHFWPENFRINDLCDFFIEQNIEVDVLCGLPNYPEGKFYKGYGYLKKRKEHHSKIKIQRVLEIPRGNNSNFRIFINYISFPFFSLFHIPGLLFRKYDKIFIYQLSPVYMALTGIILGKLKKIETTMYVLDLWPENLYSVLNIKSRILRKLASSSSRWHYKSVDKIVVLSEKMKNRITEVSNISKEKITIIPQSCEKIYEDKVNDINLKSKFSGRFNILFTGNISPAQDFGTIIRAAKQLKESGINDINWIIVGSGMSKSWLKNEVRKNGISNIFYFEGTKPIEDIPKYTNIADVLISGLVKSTLLEATIPAKISSYLASGKPIVLAMDGEAQEIINKNNCGFAGPAGDEIVLFENLKKMYSLSMADREKMGRNAYNYYLNHLERNKNYDKLLNFILN